MRLLLRNSPYRIANNIRSTVDVVDFSDQDEHSEQSRIAGRQLAEYRREPPQRTQPPELLRCAICGRMYSRAEVESRRWHCPGGHYLTQWQLVIIILFLYETYNWIPSCPITVGVHHNTAKIITSSINVFTVWDQRIRARSREKRWTGDWICQSRDSKIC